MELINPEQPQKVKDDGLNKRNTFIGTMLVLIGVLWLLKNLRIIDTFFLLMKGYDRIIFPGMFIIAGVVILSLYKRAR